jgi:methanogenic corrinoid protein MtbC1
MSDGSISRAAGAALEPKRADVVARVLEIYRAVRPDLMNQFDDVAIAAVQRDAGYHVDFLVQAMSAEEPSLFDDYVAWGAVLFAGLGLPEAWLTESLEFVAQAARGVVSPQEADAIDIVVRDAVVRMPDRGFVPPPFVVDRGPTGGLATNYLDALLGGERTRAVRMVLDAVDDGMRIEELYMHVIAPVQSEIGRLWLTGRATVAQEHVATSITQTALGALWPHVTSAKRIGRSVVIAAVGPELHEIGPRMVSDFFEMAGWDAHYMGANTPLSALVAEIEQRRPDVIALSTTMAPHLTDCRMAIEALRRTDAGKKARFIVGGRPFNVAPGLWTALGADGWAPEATSAVRTAGRLAGAV